MKCKSLCPKRIPKRWPWRVMKFSLNGHDGDGKNPCIVILDHSAVFPSLVDLLYSTSTQRVGLLSSSSSTPSYFNGMGHTEIYVKYLCYCYWTLNYLLFLSSTHHHHYHGMGSYGFINRKVNKQPYIAFIYTISYPFRLWTLSFDFVKQMEYDINMYVVTFRPETSEIWEILFLEQKKYNGERRKIMKRWSRWGHQHDEKEDKTRRIRRKTTKTHFIMLTYFSRVFLCFCKVKRKRRILKDDNNKTLQFSLNHCKRKNMGGNSSLRFIIFHHHTSQH